MSLITPYLRQVITLQRAGAVDRFGQPTFTAAALPARVQTTRKLVRGPEGDQVLSDATVYLEPDVSPRPVPGDRVLLDGAAHQVLSVQVAQGLTGPTHLVLYVGRA